MGHSVGEIVSGVCGRGVEAGGCGDVGGCAGAVDAGVGGGWRDGLAWPQPKHEVAKLLRDGVAIAAINGPESVVISGAEPAVNAIAQELAQQGRRVRRLSVRTRFIRR